MAMKSGVKKAPSVDFSLLPAVADAATKAARAAGVKGMFAVPMKRTVQWRLDFNSDKRKANATKRKDAEKFTSFSVSKNVVARKMKAQGVDYDTIMTAAYASQGLNFLASPIDMTPKASKKPKAKKASIKTKVKKASKKNDAAVVTAVTKVVTENLPDAVLESEVDALLNA